MKNESVAIRSLGHDERWLEEQIKNDPTILNLGTAPLKVKGAQVIQPKAGRLDLLLCDKDEG